MRIGTDILQRSLVATLNERQSELGELQQRISTGKRLLRASDDPSAVGRAERARNAQQRIEADQRALAAQRATLQHAETALGQSVEALQGARELMLQASSGALSNADRTSIALQLRNLRDELLSLANRRDANGLAVFGGPGASGTPFVMTSGGLVYQGVSVQATPTQSSVPGSMDGQRLWMNLPDGNGVFGVTPQAGNMGSLWSDQGEVTDPAALTGHGYEVRFAVTASGGGTQTTWSVVNPQSGQTVVPPQPYVDGQAIRFDGISLVARGAPAHGDALVVAPSGYSDMFSMLDRAAEAVVAGGPQLKAEMARATREADTAMDRLLMGRTLAGEWLRRADAIDHLQQDQKLDVEQLRASAEDIDMVDSISQLQTAQSSLEVALKTYAQIQRLSLFNYLG